MYRPPVTNDSEAADVAGKRTSLTLVQLNKTNPIDH